MQLKPTNASSVNQCLKLRKEGNALNYNCEYEELTVSGDISVSGSECCFGEYNSQPDVLRWAKQHKSPSKKKKHHKHNDIYADPTYSLSRNPVAQYQLQKFESAFTKRCGKDIPANMLFEPTQESGILFGSFVDEGGELQFVGKRAEKDGHVAVFGGSGSGKTTSIAAPTCATWKSPLFAFDLKGDLLQHRNKSETKVLYLLSGQENVFYYDPFDLLRKEGENTLVSNARELTNAIIPLPLDTREPFWINGARAILTGSIIYYFRLGLDFIETIVKIKTTRLLELLDKIATDNLASACINPDVALNPRMLAGISEELHQHLTVFATDEIIISALSSSPESSKIPLHWEDLEYGDIIIRMDQSRSEQWGSIIRLMLVQLIRTLERRPEMYTPEGFHIRPTLLLLDEFPKFGKIEEFVSAMRILRSKNVTFAIFAQSVADLDEIYGINTRRTILDNCQFQAVLSAFDPETQQYFSSKIGVDTFPSTSVTANYDPNGAYLGYSGNISETIQPIMFPHEFATLNDVVLLHPWPGGFCRVQKILPEQQRTTPKLCVDIKKR